jgi:hypothetical protein
MTACLSATTLIPQVNNPLLLTTHMVETSGSPSVWALLPC